MTIDFLIEYLINTTHTYVEISIAKWFIAQLKSETL